MNNFYLATRQISSMMHKMHSVYLQSLGFVAIAIGLIVNTTALYLMRKEKSLQTHRDLLTCINASRILFNVVVLLWWITWASYHGRGLEKAIFIVVDALHLWYIFIVLGLTVDRLVAITAPVQYKAMPAQHVHLIFTLISAVVSILMVITFTIFHKEIEVRAYTTLTTDSCFVLIIIAIYLSIHKRWNNRMVLAKIHIWDLHICQR